MRSKFNLKSCIRNTALVAALTVAGCAGIQNRPNTAAPGSTFASAVRNTGSYGNQNAEARTRVAGEKTWQGTKVFVYERPGNPQGDIITEIDTGKWIAWAKGDAAILSWEPPIGFNWPLNVGETWSRKHRLTNHATKQSTDFTGTWKVESNEPVTVPAGTFEAYKVVFSDTMGTQGAQWFSPELGIFVKTNFQRSAKHPAGPGTSETELLSRPAMP